MTAADSVIIEDLRARLAAAQDEAWANWSSYKTAVARVEAMEQALRQIADGDLVTVPTSDPLPVIIDGNKATARYVDELSAREIARAALTRSGGEQPDNAR